MEQSFRSVFFSSPYSDYSKNGWRNISTPRVRLLDVDTVNFTFESDNEGRFSTVSTYSSGYVWSLKAANGFVFSIKQSKEMETKRHVTEDLNPQHRRLTLRLLMSYIYIYMEHLFLMFLDHTQRRSTVGRTPLDE